MLKVEVKSEDINVKTGNSNGRPWEIREQAAYWHQDGEPVPVKIHINLDRNDSPYKVGFYQILPQSFYVGKYGQLMVGRLQLGPIDSGKKAA